MENILSPFFYSNPDDSEQVKVRAPTSAHVIKTTIASNPSLHSSASTSTIRPTTTNVITTTTSATTMSTNRKSANDTNTKNNQNNVKNDFLSTIGSTKTFKDPSTLSITNDETAKPYINANAEYYQYFTDDSYRTKVDVAHFSEKSWMAFPVLRGAYKYVQVQFSKQYCMRHYNIHNWWGGITTTKKSFAHFY